MPEAVTTGRQPFAPLTQGTVSSTEEAHVPREPMHTHQRTSAALLAASRGPGRRSRLAFAGVLAALVLLVTAGPAASLSTEYTFTITGHGWGHGVGMSQWGAYGYAKHGWEYKAILKHYFTGISFDSVADSTIRVNLRSGLSAVKLTCDHDYTVQGTGAATTIPAGTAATTTSTSQGYRVVAGSVRKTFTGAPTFKPSTGALKLITTTDLGDNGAYRGAIRVVNSSGLMMINDVPLESYLRGVVPHEVSYQWPMEALKAQACAARAFALGSRQPSKSWDVYCDVRDQAYVGVGIEKDRTNTAVEGTAGVCPSYDGKPIVATYFSCSGGQTEDVKYVWGGTYPYLKGVDDPYDYYGSLHDWGPLRRSPSKVGSPLGAAGSLRAVYTVKRGASPRIVKAALIGSKGTKFIDGGSLRMKLGLNSTWAVFTSMGISPAARDGASISSGGSITLSGRIYPALAEGTEVRLHYKYDSKWRSRGVATTRKSEKLPGGYTANYSVYSEPVSPIATTKYYFSSGTAKSATTTIRVN